MPSFFLDGGHFKDYKILRDYFSDIDKVVLLTDGKKDEEYIKKWKKNFRKDLVVINNDIEKKYLDAIKDADGVLIGGGVVELYDKYYNNLEFKNILKTKKKIFGTSAGAMLLGKYFWLKGIEVNGKNISSKMKGYTGKFEYKKGLGLLNFVFGPHIFEHDEEKSVKYIMNQANIKNGLGLDENTHVIIENGEIKREFGEGNVYFY